MALVKRRPRPRRQFADSVWATVIFGVTGGCLLFAVSSQTEVGNILRWANLTKNGDRPSQFERLTSDDEIRTGSIVFMPPQGDDCVQNLFDNDTGQIWILGKVPCDVALSMKRPRYASTPARLQAISNNFRK